MKRRKNERNKKKYEMERKKKEKSVLQNEVKESERKWGNR